MLKPRRGEGEEEGEEEDEEEEEEEEEEEDDEASSASSLSCKSQYGPTRKGMYPASLHARLMLSEVKVASIAGLAHSRIWATVRLVL